MAILAFILIAHEPADVVARSIDMLLLIDPVCTVAVHYDRNAPENEFKALERRYAAQERVLLIAERARCGWGQFGLVEGTMRALRQLHDSGKAYTHAYLVSCSCWPLRPLAELRAFLDRSAGRDFIESHDESWMTGGLRSERYTLRHPFGFARRRGLFEASVALQRRLGMKRRIPDGLSPRYGSQWWCLRRETVEKVLDWISANPHAWRFYRQVWIPDETFFQTVMDALDLTPEDDFIPTLYTFNAHGKPIVFYDDHIEWLLRQPYFFARKIAPSAYRCREALLARACVPGVTEDASLILSTPSVKIAPARRPAPTYGQIFEPGSGIRNWARNLETITPHCAVLYGPPQLTGMASAILRESRELTVLGRLFRPDRIEFQPRLDTFHGLRADDVKLRDYDRALYLARILSRCTGFPVFELCPGEDSVLERRVLDGEALVAIPVLPGGRGRDWRFLFWYLALPDALRDRIDKRVDRQEGRRDRILTGVWESARQHFGPKYLARLERRLYGPAPERRGIAFSEERQDADADWKAALRFRHGEPVVPLLAALDKLADAFSGQDWREIAPSLALPSGEGKRHG